MILQTILYGQFQPPPVMDSRKYSMWSNGANPYPGYTPPVNRDTKYKAITQKITKALTDSPGLTRKELTEATGATSSYLHRAVDFLLEGEIIRGVKGVPRSGGYQSMIYFLKE